MTSIWGIKRSLGRSWYVYIHACMYIYIYIYARNNIYIYIYRALVAEVSGEKKLTEFAYRMCLAQTEFFEETKNLQNLPIECALPKLSF